MHPNIAFNANRTQVTISGDVRSHLEGGMNIIENDFIDTLLENGKETHTVFFAADQSEIDSLAFSRFRKKTGDDSEYILPQLKQLVFHNGIKKLPNVSPVQLLKYIERGVSFTCSPELHNYIRKQIEKLPGFPHDFESPPSPPLSIELAKMLLENQKFINEQASKFQDKIYQVQAEASRDIGEDLYVFTLNDEHNPGETVAKMSLYAKNEAEARSEMVNALANPTIKGINNRLHLKVDAQDFSMEVLRGRQKEQEYHERRGNRGEIWYGVKNNQETLSTAIPHSQYTRNVKALSQHLENIVHPSGPLVPLARRGDKLQQKYEYLLQLCEDYKAHLEHSVGIEKLMEEPPYAEEEEPSLELARSKYAIVDTMLEILKDPAVDSIEERINNVAGILTPENKQTLKEQRNFSFLEKVLHLFGFSPEKGSLSFFKSHGETLVNKVEENDLDKPFMGG